MFAECNHRIDKHFFKKCKGLGGFSVSQFVRNFLLIKQYTVFTWINAAATYIHTYTVNHLCKMIAVTIQGGYYLRVAFITM